MNKQVPWLRVFAEGVVIVGSILLAFGLQAWWESRRERVEEQGYLVALLDDIDAIVLEANRTISLNDSTTDRSLERIAALEALRVVPDSLLLAEQSIFKLRANLDTYNDILSSGSVTQLRDPNVRRLLAILRAELDFEGETMGYAVDALSLDRSALNSAHAVGAPNLWSMSIRVEEGMNTWRESHVARKRDVIRAALDAQAAIKAAIDGGGRAP